MILVTPKTSGTKLWVILQSENFSLQFWKCDVFMQQFQFDFYYSFIGFLIALKLSLRQLL